MCSDHWWLVPAQVLGTDAEEEKMAVKFADGGPFVGLDPGIDSTALGEDYVALPKKGDKVSLSTELSTKYIL